MNSRMLVPEPAEQEVIGLMTSLHQEGCEFLMIAERLNDKVSLAC